MNRQRTPNPSLKDEFFFRFFQQPHVFIGHTQRIPGFRIELSVGGATTAGEASTGTTRETGACGAAAGGDDAGVGSTTGGGEGGGAIGADAAVNPVA